MSGKHDVRTRSIPLPILGLDLEEDAASQYFTLLPMFLFKLKPL